MIVREQRWARCPARLVLAAGLLVLGTTHARAQDSSPRAAAVRAGERHPETGDRIIVRVAREPLLGDTVVVDGQGEIVLPKLGTIAVSRLSIQELPDSLRARYATFLRSPSVDVQVLRRVAVNGDVAKPDVYYAEVNRTLRDMIATAGGITEIGDPSSVSIIRGGTVIPAPRWREDYSEASDLHSGDEIFVGRRSWIARNGIAFASSAAVLLSVLLSIVRK